MLVITDTNLNRLCIRIDMALCVCVNFVEGFIVNTDKNARRIFTTFFQTYTKSSNTKQFLLKHEKGKGKNELYLVCCVRCPQYNRWIESNYVACDFIQTTHPLSRSLQNPQSFWSKIRISMFTVRNSIQTESLLLAAVFHEHCFFVSIALVLSPLIFIGSHRNTGDEKKNACEQ